MVLLSALSSEYFLTWLLNMLWAGTWHRAALAPEVLALFRMKCHCAWLRSASGEGEAKHSVVALHSSSDTALQTSVPSESSKWWAGRAELHLHKAGDRWFLWDMGWAGRCLMLCHVQAVKLLLLEEPAQPLVLVLLPARTCVESWGKGEIAWVSHHLSLSPVQLPCHCSSPFASTHSC